MNIKSKSTVAILLCIFIVLFSSTSLIFAENNNFELVGKLYEFENNDKYDLSSYSVCTPTTETSIYGKLQISGNISNEREKDKLPAYSLNDSELKINYKYDNSMLNASENEWHIISDDSKEVFGVKRGEKVQNGAILVQTSTDGINWIDEKYITNVFYDIPISSDSIYTSTELQHLNGCYYRVSILYSLKIKEDPNEVLFLEFDNYKEKKVAEIYEFYLYPRNDNNSDELLQKHSLGEKIKVENEDGYSGSEEIDKDDIHYGWNLGNFYVSGFTAKTNKNSENITFLKNAGDKITLWFKLEQDLTKLNGNEKLSISADTEGFSQDFETPRTDFGKGTMIIEHTDYQGIKSEPQIYTNYLEANTKLGADTKVQNFEEGDYTVGLFYEVSENKLFGDVNHYKILFSFSVRNGNCMVYPFDSITGEELSNNNITDNGFYLDLANSRYLNINVKKEVLSDSANGLVEDIRFNKPAADGEKYTDEGIYTITVTNPYTEQTTVKKICVGTNNILKAHSTTGLSIEEINDLLADGCEISSDGEIIKAAMIAENNDLNVDNLSNAPQTNINYFYTIFGSIIILIIVVISIILIKIKRKKSKLIDNNKDTIGGINE